MIDLEIKPILESKPDNPSNEAVAGPDLTENTTDNVSDNDETNTANQLEEEKENTTVAEAHDVIVVKNVDIYQKKILILSDVSFSVKQGEMLYVIGKTGSGKSNLLKILYGEVPIRNGELTVAGFNMLKIKSKNIQRLRRKLGIVFQDFQLLYDRSIYENLKFITKVTGWKDRVKRDERIEEVLNLVGLKTKGHKMPHQLSGGEQQRVCIARALVNNPEIILADEPTGNLDPDTSLEIVKLFHEISKKGTSVIIATHNYNIINQIPSRLLRIEQGKVIE
ncbi:MAG TPA: ATP-binding cassette domain-containing protein [Bacteroidales bacterium]|nr:ATP-binding cassette domain-containing protein [Bacteroidales bacterium]HON20812.1 ATP-binding cassette domain-containing protein [Bacteroidales bacterium]HOR82720.1 ATP-binding cassette domain-containing protein [Bacteroidales bacterium]HPJ91882.1 ATP-binding cassette domain-containing protein [Bacteroidales bacterium]